MRRLAFIGAAKHLGLPLEEIAGLLTVWQSGACVEVKADLRPRIADRLAEAEQRSAELAAFTASLRAALEHLDALPDRTAPCDPECGFLSHSAATPAIGRAVEVVLSPNPQAADELSERWRSAPVACSLTGEGMTERVAQWRSALDGAVRVEIPDGLRLTVSADRFTVLAELATAEQRCCPFFDFRFHLSGSDLHLEVRAPAEGASLLVGLFAVA